jgi:protease-4
MSAVMHMADTRNRNLIFLMLFFGAAIVTVVVLAVYFLFALGIGDRAIPIGDAVAVVDVVGEIYYDRDKVDEINSYRDDDNIKAVVIYINSPGGGVAASQAIYHAVARLAEAKPVVACMGSVAASGGYYVACAADSIMAREGTLTGSIGVIAAFLRTEELYRKIGLDITVIKSGRWKDVGSPHREMTPEERIYLSGILDSAYEQFLTAVSDGRGLPVAEVRTLAEGRLYTGEQAQDAGLVDHMGSYQDAIDMAARMGGIDGDPRVVKRQFRRSLHERIFGKTLLPLVGTHEERVALRYIIP